MGWIGCVHCEKSRCHFMARTFALIAPVHPILHRFSCSYEMIPNAPKQYETHRNMSLGFNRVDQVCLLGKITLDFVARTFALIAPVPYVLHQVSCSYETIPNAPKYYETYRNITLGSNWVDWDCPLQKIPTSLRGMNFCINCTSSPRFAPRFIKLRNNPKCTKILQRSNGVDSVHSLQKNPDVTSWHEL